MPLVDFPFEPLFAVLDGMEQQGKDVSEAVDALDPAHVHPGLKEWVSQVAPRFAAAVAQAHDALNVTLRLEPREWVAATTTMSPTGEVTYEQCAWGRRYVSADGHVRELWLPRLRTLQGKSRTRAEVAVAAHVTAHGVPVRPGTRNNQPYEPLAADAVDYVRVMEIGCDDEPMQPRVVFAGRPEEARALYTSEVRQELRAAIDGSTYQPGEDCSDCKLLDACPRLLQLPGLLGIHDDTKQRRTWSVTNGRTYDRCPAKDHLRRLKLPRQREVEYSTTVQRGHAVHDWLQHMHLRTPSQPCGSADVPDNPEAWSIGDRALDGDQARLGYDMIADHAAVCPLRNAPSGRAVYPEYQITVFDPAAQVVVIAKVDLLYQDGETWVIRETKTHDRTPPPPADLSQFPQLALSLLLIADHPSLSTVGRVELEQLTSTGPLLTTFHPDDPSQLSQARQIVHDLIAPWHSDTTAPTNPGAACRSCEVARWCPDAATTTEEYA